MTAVHIKQKNQIDAKRGFYFPSFQYAVRVIKCSWIHLVVYHSLDREVRSWRCVVLLPGVSLPLKPKKKPTEPQTIEKHLWVTQNLQ